MSALALAACNLPRQAHLPAKTGRFAKRDVAPMRLSMTTDAQLPSRFHRILCRLHGLFATLIGLVLVIFGGIAIAARVMGSTLGGVVDKADGTPILLGLFIVTIG